MVVYFRSRHAVHPTTNIHTLRTRTYNVVSRRGRRIKEEEEERVRNEERDRSIGRTEGGGGVANEKDE